MITVVTGLPRSGTSLAMQLLEAAGIPPYTDGVRHADAANAHGYYEAEVVKQLPGHTAWLEEVEGMAVKVIHQLLPSLPLEYAYRVLVMQRSLPAVLESQRRLLTLLGKAGSNLSDERLVTVYRAQLQAMERWLQRLPSGQVWRLDFEACRADPASAADGLLSWLGRSCADSERRRRVAAIVRKS